MISFLKNLFGIGPQVNYAELIKNGAQILDVRTSPEFKTGNIRGSINIPVQVLHQQFSHLKKNKPVITCCASGSRSAVAKNILLANGFAEVYNGGGWYFLNQKINNNASGAW
jgi:rhodanese-related sulfurtransferase